MNNNRDREWFNSKDEQAKQVIAVAASEQVPHLKNTAYLHFKLLTFTAPNRIFGAYIDKEGNAV